MGDATSTLSARPLKPWCSSRPSAHAWRELLIKIGEEVSEHFDYRPASIIRARIVSHQ
jgi:hypothetical protein